MDSWIHTLHLLCRWQKYIYYTFAIQNHEINIFYILTFGNIMIKTHQENELGLHQYRTLHPNGHLRQEQVHTYLER